MLQYTSSDTTSTIVVMNGLATTAGSKCNFLASKGSAEPTIFAMMIVITIAIHITNEIITE